jgi:hypothetical protein
VAPRGGRDLAGEVAVRGRLRCAAAPLPVCPLVWTLECEVTRVSCDCEAEVGNSWLSCLGGLLLGYEHWAAA